MAFFRVGDPPRADVERAVRAAVAMRDAAAAVSARLRQEGREPLQLGFGLHYGDVVVGLIGSPVHLVNYTVLGQPVIVSQRLQGIAAGGEVIVSEAVFQAAGDSLRAVAREPVAVKGLSEPVAAVRGHRVGADPAATPESGGTPPVDARSRAGDVSTPDQSPAIPSPPRAHHPRLARGRSRQGNSPVAAAGVFAGFRAGIVAPRECVERHPNRLARPKPRARPVRPMATETSGALARHGPGITRHRPRRTRRRPTARRIGKRSSPHAAAGPGSAARTAAVDPRSELGR